MLTPRLQARWAEEDEQQRAREQRERDRQARLAEEVKAFNADKLAKDRAEVERVRAAAWGRAGWLLGESLSESPKGFGSTEHL